MEPNFVHQLFTFYVVEPSDANLTPNVHLEGKNEMETRRTSGLVVPDNLGFPQSHPSTRQLLPRPSIILTTI
jgi:hypothetical protein